MNTPEDKIIAPVTHTDSAGAKKVPQLTRADGLFLNTPLSNTRLFDTHCHLDYSPLVEEAGRWIQQGAEQGIAATLVPATTYARFDHLCQFVRAHNGLYLALGLHPIYLSEHTDDVIEACADWIVREQPCAIGEVGLDYFVETLDRERQQQLFERMIALATRYALPLVLHVRRSHDAIIATLKRKKFAQGGIVHAFAGSHEQAREFMKLGFKLGFGGVMSYAGSRRVRALASTLALTDIVLETDAPDMKPADWPLDYNSPLALLTNFQALCTLRSESPEEIASVTTANAYQILHIIPPMCAAVKTQ